MKTLLIFSYVQCVHIIDDICRVNNICVRINQIIEPYICYIYPYQAAYC